MPRGRRLPEPPIYQFRGRILGGFYAPAKSTTNWRVLEVAANQTGDLQAPRLGVERRTKRSVALVVDDAEESLVRGDPGVEILPDELISGAGRWLRRRLVGPAKDLLTLLTRERMRWLGKMEKRQPSQRPTSGQQRIPT